MYWVVMCGVFKCKVFVWGCYGRKRLTCSQLNPTKPIFVLKPSMRPQHLNTSTHQHLNTYD